MLSLARILFTVGCFGAFLIFVLIAYRKGAKSGYDQIAQEIVDDDDTPVTDNFSGSLKKDLNKEKAE
ncbi:MAG: CcoQ/FixQ family Cbb3-type cytochrome c oxidase assembly chaperone [Neisseriaceae bacterium]|nr:CcoQ/FixQ family Cbb3-type cytochrome c oxidase assembly chaperone [Neisseriaceae bacterium]MBO7554830.1 CcoQ/FixQ family Cbb3-type cytochrome c oxidase assembly chaperone [Neisseriaceae bacterium]